MKRLHYKQYVFTNGKLFDEVMKKHGKALWRYDDVEVYGVCNDSLSPIYELVNYGSRDLLIARRVSKNGKTYLKYGN